MWCDWWYFAKGRYCPGGKFQFQCGAIGGEKPKPEDKTLNQFQFQCGAIGGVKKYAICILHWSFNSSVVRLVAEPDVIGKEEFEVFQFQCGAIGGKYLHLTQT